MDIDVVDLPDGIGRLLRLFERGLISRLELVTEFQHLLVGDALPPGDATTTWQHVTERLSGHEVIEEYQLELGQAVYGLYGEAYLTRTWVGSDDSMQLTWCAAALHHAKSEDDLKWVLRIATVDGHDQSHEVSGRVAELARRRSVVDRPAEWPRHGWPALHPYADAVTIDSGWLPEPPDAYDGRPLTISRAWSLLHATSSRSEAIAAWARLGVEIGLRTDWLGDGYVQGLVHGIASSTGEEARRGVNISGSFPTRKCATRFVSLHVARCRHADHGAPDWLHG